MKQRSKFQRILSLFLTVLMAAVLIVPTALSVSAANKHFITELRLEKGDEALTELEEQGWSVMLTGLNATTDTASQVYLLYKVDTGSPLTDVVVSPDVGESFTDKNGVVYKCVSHVDVDEGIGGGAGCLYAATDEKAGSAIVAFDVLRSNKESSEPLYPITNDGAEIVANVNGTPADIEAASQTDVIYLAMIRDGLVKPYIREIGIITDTDKWNAVYTAFERGFTYYVDGDIDTSSDTYTIIGYERTIDPADAVTNVIAITSQTISTLEKRQILDDAENETNKTVTASAVSISGTEYARISSEPVKADEPFYLYRTKDPKAGNPVSMLYAEAYTQDQNFLFGTWANGYFFTKGATTAHSYCMNEDIYTTFWDDKTVVTKLPVQILDNITTTNTTFTGTEGDDASSEASAGQTSAQPSVQEASAGQTSAQPSAQEASAGQTSAQPSAQEASAGQTSAQPSEQEASAEGSANASSADTEQSDIEPAEEAAAAESSAEAEPVEQELTAPDNTQTTQTVRYIDLTMLTPKDGLPDTTAALTGMRADPDAPYVERTERSDRINKLQASVFASPNIITPILGGVVLLTALGVWLFKRHSTKKALAAAQTNASARSGKSGKAGKSKKSKKKR